MKPRSILVLNAGSSSIKFALFDATNLPRQPWWNGKVQGIGGPAPDFGARDVAPFPITLDAARPYRSALALILERVAEALGGCRPVAGVHRVVHGGTRWFEPVRTTPEILEDLRRLIPLAPLHQPFALDAIDILAEAEPDLPQFACFDTGFHQTVPEVERALPLPHEFRDRGLRRYGFHGLSYAYMATALAERHGALADRRVIVAHLGSGASLCAMEGRRSRATTMGFSALDGLMMGTRSGAIDPGAVLYLMEIERLSLEEVGGLLYHRAGLIGVSGISAEPRVIVRHEDDPGAAGARARLALDLYVRRIVRETGALTAVLGGLDLMVFTAGVGEHNGFIRERVCRDLGFLGIALDAQANAADAPIISSAQSRVVVGVEPTNEEWVMARAAHALLAAG